ncbi:WD40-repeat-containing domain protein, partial [Rhizoctonia solani]
ESLVNSVVFSPNGNHIAFGGDDATIQVCNVHTGAIVSGPFKGDMGHVYSVVFSPDGNCIASGSRDKTIITWKLDDGSIASEPFCRHMDKVWSVVFSNNGKCLALGSHDWTIIVWDSLVLGQVPTQTISWTFIVLFPTHLATTFRSHDYMRICQLAAHDCNTSRTCTSWVSLSHPCLLICPNICLYVCNWTHCTTFIAFLLTHVYTFSSVK